MEVPTPARCISEITRSRALGRDESSDVCPGNLESCGEHVLSSSYLGCTTENRKAAVSRYGHVEFVNVWVGIKGKYLRSDQVSALGEGQSVW